MSLRIGIVSTAHLHVWSYANALKNHPKAIAVGAWDDDAERLAEFAAKSEIPAFPTLEALLAECDAVAICCENMKHAPFIEAAAAAGKHIICEKPLAPTREHAERIMAAVEASGVKVMTAFPCRYSPAYRALKHKIEAGDVGGIKAICATNRGSCPMGWFVQTELSGGGAMIDHVVHVADLLRDLLQEEPVRVQAQTSHNMYGQEWDDCAMVTIEFASGIFVTLDSSWSRPGAYKTWGDVTMNVVGEHGVIELDMFGQGLEVFTPGQKTHTLRGWGSDTDAELFSDFIEACLTDKPTPVDHVDGIRAALVAIAGYESLKTGQPVAV